MMHTLLLATNNCGKIVEMKGLLGGLGLNLLTPTDINLNLEVPEDGQTYEENACRKATVFAFTSGLVALGDDSGLEVEALGGQPGLHSHRFAPKPNATDADRCNYLLQQLQGMPRPWMARFHATVAVAVPSGEVRFVTGVCKGEIISDERGTNGFGYDPIFFLTEQGRTMAELTKDEKNRLSHRSRAVQKIIPILIEIFGLENIRGPSNKPS